MDREEIRNQIAKLEVLIETIENDIGVVSIDELDKLALELLDKKNTAETRLNKIRNEIIETKEKIDLLRKDLQM